MNLPFSKWPFLPTSHRTKDEDHQWWSECFVPATGQDALRSGYSVIVTGQSGSGKSISLKYLEKQEADDYLIIHYPIDQWPERLPTQIKGVYHFSQILTCASTTIGDLLRSQPDLSHNLTAIDIEFLRWLVEKYGGRRAFRSLTNAVGNPTLLSFASQEFEDLYATDVEIRDVREQIAELRTLCRRLGYKKGTIILVDINEVDTNDDDLLIRVQDLFGWLTLLQFEGFAIKATLPEKVVEKSRLVELTRGRVKFISLRWDQQTCRTISDRHLYLATDKKLQGLAQLASDKLLQALGKNIPTLYTYPLPRSWLHLTHILLDEYVEYGRELTMKHDEDILYQYFSKYVPLRFDQKGQGVWLDEVFIRLDNQPFTFLEVLWRHRNNSDSSHEALQEIAGTQGNLNTIASRLRKTIEPIPNRPIYIRNSRNHGYWLENIVEY